MKRIFTTLFLVYLQAAAFASQKPMIEVNSNVDSSMITIGDQITYTITIDYSDTLSIEKPGEGVNLGQFEIKDYTIFEPVREDNRVFQKYEYVIFWICILLVSEYIDNLIVGPDPRGI